MVFVQCVFAKVHCAKAPKLQSSKVHCAKVYADPGSFGNVEGFYAGIHFGGIGTCTGGIGGSSI